MKKVLAIMLCLALVLSLAACGGEKPAETAKTNDDITIGFIPMTLNNEYFITMVNGAKNEAEKEGVKIEVQAGDQHASAAAQLTIVENMISSGVDAICIVPSSSEGLFAALQKCKEAKIPVINIDTPVTADIQKQAEVDLPFYGTNNYNGAKLAGEYVANNFEAGTKVAVLLGMEGQQNRYDRYDGFVEGAGDKITIVAEQSANWEVDQGYTAAQNILTANPDLNLIYCENDGMAIGAVRAVEEAGKLDQVSIIGFDGISEAMNLIQAGKLMGSVSQYPGEMGILGVKNAVIAAKGGTPEQDIDTGAKLITSENVAEHQEYLKQFA